MTRLLPLLLLAAPASAATFTLARAIPNPAPAVADFFGSSLALAGGTLAVGARFDDPASKSNAGAAYLFDLTTGATLATFTAPAPVAGDQLGFALATLGGDVLVSAPDVNARAGVVYRFPGGASYAGSVPGAKLGYALAAANGDVLAGAPFDGSAGGAYVFDAGSGALRLTLPNPTPAAADVFGRAVATTGTILVVAAPLDDAGAVNAGVVHLFDRDTGVFLRTFASPQPHAGDNFGTALAADATRILVGSPFAAPAGAAFLFDAASGTLLRTFTSPAADAHFGAAVALSGNAVLVGAPFADVGAVDAGAAYVFDATSGALLATLASPAPHAGDQFGAAVALEGRTAAVGAWLDDMGADNAGAAYVFVDVSLPTTSSTTSTSSSTSSSTSTSTSSTTTSSTTTSTTGVTASSTTSTATTTSTASALPTTSTSTSLTVTTTRSPGTEPTTSTTAAVTCAAGCDDGDPCTVDTCLPSGTCDRVAVTGFDGVVCRLDLVDAALHGPRLAGARLTSRLRLKLARARRLVEAARAPDAGSAVARRAERALTGFIALLKQAQHAGRIAYARADDLVTLSTDAAVQLAPLE